MRLALLLVFSMNVHSEILTINIKRYKAKSKPRIGVLVFDKEKGFPKKEDSAIFRDFFHSSNIKIKLKKGTYAISVFEDENNDGKLNTNFIGIPKEGVGFSNNSKLIFGPPDFEDSKILLDESKTIHIELKHF
ncbi:MAG: DUF2141 domain-containing protein [Bacteriovoracaceae bacterium]|jgi:uncharacterized protein (DUF2141 family)|nr:DUF2141 domain-containing protein [Bacteriovoracaceae bacterium]